MVRVFTLCLSLALAVLGVVGLTVGAPTWLIIVDFAAAAVGVGLDALLWATQGRWSIIVAFAMSAALVAVFFSGVVVNAAPWLCWSIFAIAVAFFATGCARAFSPSLQGGELR